MPADVRFGSELPRIFTPPLRDLSQPDATLGHDFCVFAEAIGVHLFPWERWLALAALELNQDGTLRFRTVILLVARQNGKTTILKLLALFWMYVLGRTLTVGTAQNLETAEETWQDTVNLAKAVDDLAADIEHIVMQSGKKSLQLTTGERYKVVPSNRGGGRGLSGDLVEMDELREHRTWESWAAVSNTTMAIDSALVVAASNAGDLLSVVLRALRFMCMSDPATVGVTEKELQSFGIVPTSDPDADDVTVDSVGIFEWSAAPDRRIWDRDGWAEANPSMGHSRAIESALAATAKIATAGSEAEWTFRTENLCQWRPTAAGGPFPDGAWEAGVDDHSEIAGDSPLCVCADTETERDVTHVAVAGFRPDGHVHVEVIATRVGLEWVLPWLTGPERPVWRAVTVQGNGAPISSLSDLLEASDLPLVQWSGADLPKGCGSLFDLVRLPRKDDPDDADKRLVFHLPQPVIDVQAATAVTKPLGDGWVFDRRKSPQGAAAVMAAAGAVWLLLQPPAEVKTPQVHEWPAELLAQMGG